MNAALFTSNSQEWETPAELFKSLDKEFHFTLDPCSTHENAKCKKHFIKEENGLAKDWAGETVYCNPPYGREIHKWIKKCHDHAASGGGTAVMLLPARTDTQAFHQYIYHRAEIRFLKGRIRFSGAKNSAPFPSMIVIFRQAGR